MAISTTLPTARAVNGHHPSATDTEASSGSLNGNGLPCDSSENEAIAIIGMACRLPGNVTSPDNLWDFLCEGKSAQSDVPKSRFNVDAFYNPQNELPDTVAMRGGYFLDEDIRLFENSFFGVNNLEATYLDPQMRKLLEVCYECLESAGVRDVDVSGKDVGCYVGNFTADYPAMCGKDTGHQHRMVTLAMSAAVLSNRVSYLLNLMGPSLTLDTACSSSLYCLHLAVNALRGRECEAAFVAGANLVQSHEQSMSIGRYGFLSKTSTCHTFDSSADGYGRADGVGALYLKRLSDAIRDKDPIRAVIRGTAINSNGKTTSNITVPSTEGQAYVIAKAYANAGLDPTSTDYVECHGTGTQIGDIIEVDVLADSMRNKTHAPSKPLFAGSVKTNLGHSEASSGITSIIKVAMALENEWIPPTIGVSELNPKFDWASNSLRVVTSGQPWPKQSKTKRASVNSFGFGGANGHCILERYTPDGRPTLPSYSSDYPCVLPLSAASKPSLRRRTEDLSRVSKPMDIHDLAYTLINRRSKQSTRGYLVAKDKDWQTCINFDRFESSCVQQSDPKPLAFVFTGQGAQWVGMGEHLFHRYPTFRQTITRLDGVLANLPNPPDWSLSDLLTNSRDGDWSASPLCSQTACTGLQIGLVDLLREWRIIPRYVMGHSAGEISAAYAAGYISASRAIVIAYGRGLQVAALSSPGAMIAVGLGEVQAREEINRLGLAQSISVACINSPESTTISGDEAAIGNLLDDLVAKETFARRLKTGGVAYHSHHMKAIGSSYEQYLECLTGDLTNGIAAVQSPEVIMISSVHARIIDQHEAASAMYWKMNLESPVRFQQAVEVLQALETTQMIEIGPHSSLELPTKQTIQKVQGNSSYLASIRRHQDASICLMDLAGSLWCQGHEVDLNAVNIPIEEQREWPRVLPSIPRYPWNYGAPLWKESRRSEEYRHRKFAHDELLGTLVPGMSGSTHTWRNKLFIKDVPWLADHRLSGQFVFPGAAYVHMALKAMQQIYSVQDECIVIRNMRLLSALTFDESEGVEIFTELQKQPFSSVEEHRASWDFTISTWGDGQTVRRAVGVIAAVLPQQMAVHNKMSWNDSADAVQKSDGWYRQLSEVGVDYGPAFQMLSAVSVPSMRDSNVCHATFADLKIPLDKHQGRFEYHVHPTVLDAILQTGLIAHAQGNIEDVQGLVPTAFHYINFYPSFSHDALTAYELRTHEKSVAAGISVFDSELRDGQGHVLMEMSADAKQYTKSTFQATPEQRHPILQVEWTPALDLVSVSQGRALAASLTNNLYPGDGRRGEMLRLLHFASLNRCNTHMLIVSSEEEIHSVWTTIGGDTAHPRFSQLTFVPPTQSEVLQGYTVSSKAIPTWNELELVELPSSTTYDIILVDQDQPHIHHQRLIDLLAPDGVMFRFDSGDLTTSVPIEDIVTGANQDIHMIRRRPTSPPASDSSSGPIVIITSDEPSDSAANLALRSALSNALGVEPVLQPLSTLSPSCLTGSTFAIVTAELSKPALTCLSPSQLSALQLLISSMKRILWITGESIGPDGGAVLGFSRAVMLESPSVTFQVLELEISEPGEDTQSAMDVVRQIAERAAGAGQEHIFSQRGGLIHVSRFVPHAELNDKFNAKKESRLIKREARKDEVLEMDIKMPGQFDTLLFKERSKPTCVLDGDVELEVKAIGINAKDVYALSGLVKTVERTFAMDYAGVVRKVSTDHHGLAVGDRVAVCTAGPFATIVTVPGPCCVPLRDDESFTQMSTVPLAFMTALHALEDRAHLQSGESVLIHSAAGGVGMAAIQVAKRLGATIYATTGTDEKREMLVKEFGLPPEHIFSSRNTSFLEDIMKATGGRGVDVVLNSLTGERLRASVTACAYFGRFIEIGKKDIADGGVLDLSAFKRSLTFSAFDLTDYLYSLVPEERNVIARLSKRAIDLYRSHPVPAPRVFSADRVSGAYHTFANSKRAGKICVSFEKSEATIQVQPRRHQYRFSPSKEYLLVGGLGGVGRSIARYMFENGARHFTFIGRSSIKPEANLLIRNLCNRGATVHVRAGDVGDPEVVREALAGLAFPLGGIVQAAMGLGESLFDTMTHAQWHSSLGPKVQGTWNIHRALEGKHEEQLDFFLMISSLVGSTGSLAESNYCAANSFLDSFAKYRRQLGRAAIALAFGTISEVGYLHEHPEIEEMLRRRGSKAITEADLLDLCDIALCNEASDRAAGAAHILTGLERTREQFVQRQITSPIMADLRASILLHAAQNDNDGDKAGTQDGNGSQRGPPQAVQAAINDRDHGAIVKAVAQVLTEQLANLILTPAEDIPADMTLANAGIDSMLAAEYRSLIFHTFGADIPFLTLMDAQTTMVRLAGRIADSLLATANA